MHLTNYSGRKYLLEVVDDKVLLDGFIVARLHREESGISDMAREFKECILKENDKTWRK